MFEFIFKRFSTKLAEEGEFLVSLNTKELFELARVYDDHILLCNVNNGTILSLEYSSINPFKPSLYKILKNFRKWELGDISSKACWYCLNYANFIYKIKLYKDRRGDIRIVKSYFDDITETYSKGNILSFGSLQRFYRVGNLFPCSFTISKKINTYKTHCSENIKVSIF